MTRNATTNRHAKTGRCRLTPRGGISLVEVLVSIGVLAIGLAGVAALIPLASHQAQQGVMEDRKAAAGRRAYREFKVRGMADPDNWIVPTGNNGAVSNDPQRPMGFVLLRRAPYCLDPLGVAAMGPGAWFPYTPISSGSGIPAMPRITLAAQPRHGTLVRLRDNNVADVPMPLLQATEVFTMQDDLIFNIPDDDVLPASQSWLTDLQNNQGNQNNLQLKRIAEGRFSWFATLVPEPMVNNDLYRLSIAVTVQRQPQQDMAAEQVARVTFLGQTPGGSGNSDVAYAGGDVTLVSDKPINARMGQWLVLGQQLPNQLADFRWYRIVATDNREGQTEREFTLQGPDWRLRSAVTWAILVPQVVSVYEKTIRLEASSLWTSYSMRQP